MQGCRVANFHTSNLDNNKGDFSIGFLIWKTDQLSQNKKSINEITTEVLDKKTKPIGEKKFFNLPNKSFWQAAIVFSVRKLIKPTWLNDRDQFLQPTEPLTDEFKNDCLIWMLFNGSNLTASANNLEWNGKTWSIVNHFIPYTEEK